MIDEFENIQNSGLAAFALYHFVNEFYKQKAKTEGPGLPLLMPVLPLLFNEDCLNELSDNQRRMTSFFRSLSDNRLIPVGLQHRMIEMSQQTFEALNIAFATNILTYSKLESQIIPVRRTKLPNLIYKDNIKITKGATLLGFWFSQLTIEEILINLNIKF